MLSIRLNKNKEWWVSANTFDRLFKAGLDSKQISSEQAGWADIVHANGGFCLSDIESEKAQALEKMILSVAETEISKFQNVKLNPEEFSYFTSLKKLLSL